MKKRKFGFITATCMVIGSVIGSGIFFKSEEINREAGGNILAGSGAWLLGGVVMLVCLGVFACMAQSCTEKPSLLEIAERTVGNTYCYYIGVFMAIMYYPAMCSVLAYLSARYTLISCGIEECGGSICFICSAFFLLLSYGILSVAPYLVGKIQVITTVFKLTPLFLMIVLGIIYKGEGVMAIQQKNSASSGFATLYGAVTKAAFAYDGWISVISMGNKIKKPQKNLVAALITGGIIVTFVYVMYYVALSNVVNGASIQLSSRESVKTAFNMIIDGSGSILTVFVAISCYGALNALMYGCMHSMYYLAEKGRCPLKRFYLKTGKKQGVPTLSAVTGVLLSLLWLAFYFDTQVSSKKALSFFSFDCSEMVVVTAYAMYLPIFYNYMKICIRKHCLGKGIISVGGIVSCGFMIFAAISSGKKETFAYLCLITAIMLAFSLCKRK